MKYPTNVELHIITENRQKLVAAAQHWQFPLGFEACSFDQAHNDNHAFSIAWEHRHHLRLAFESGASLSFHTLLWRLVCAEVECAQNFLYSSSL